MTPEAEEPSLSRRKKRVPFQTTVADCEETRAMFIATLRGKASQATEEIKNAQDRIIEEMVCNVEKLYNEDKYDTTAEMDKFQKAMASLKGLDVELITTLVNQMSAVLQTFKSWKTEPAGS